MEERRQIQEQRVRDLHLQVSEASTLDAETAAEEFVSVADVEANEDEALHHAAVQLWRG
jgi:hypothetical protein